MAIRTALHLRAPTASALFVAVVFLGVACSRSGDRAADAPTGTTRSTSGTAPVLDERAPLQGDTRHDPNGPRDPWDQPPIVGPPVAPAHSDAGRQD